MDIGGKFTTNWNLLFQMKKRVGKRYYGYLDFMAVVSASLGLLPCCSGPRRLWNSGPKIIGVGRSEGTVTSFSQQLIFGCFDIRIVPSMNDSHEDGDEELISTS